MKTVSELREHADARLFAGAYPEALHAYALLVQLHPNDLDARLRVADTLLAMGEVQAAAYVYTLLARHSAAGGHPLRALVALKVLEQLEPELAALIDQVAALYGKESERLGRGVRFSLVGESVTLPETISLTPPPLEELLPGAAKVASDLSRIAAYPEKLPPLPVFSELSAGPFGRLLKTAQLVRLRGGEVLIREGEVGSAFYMLARGKVRVVRGLPDSPGEGAGQNGGSGGQLLAELSDGAVFGEMALVSDKPRSASVIAADDCDVLRFDRDGLRTLSSELATLAAALDAFTRQRLLTNLLDHSPLFAPLSRAQRLDLARRFTAHEVAQGTHVIREGEAGLGLYLVLRGSVDVWKRDGDEKVMLATLGSGEVFGEIALVLEKETSASVTAAEPCTLLFLARDLFEKLAGAFEEIREYVESLGDERLMDTRLTMAASSTEDDDDALEIEIDVLI